jgi:hypothetical protein
VVVVVVVVVDVVVVEVDVEVVVVSAETLTLAAGPESPPLNSTTDPDTTAIAATSPAPTRAPRKLMDRIVSHPSQSDVCVSIGRGSRHLDPEYHPEWQKIPLGVVRARLAATVRQPDRARRMR